MNRKFGAPALAPDAGLRRWIRVHVFRTVTAGVTFALLVLCFLYAPDLLTWGLRATMTSIETVAGLFPYPWGDRVELAMKALGGSFWFLIASAIMMVRVLAWTAAAGWRRRHWRSDVDPPAETRD